MHSHWGTLEKACCQIGPSWPGIWEKSDLTLIPRGSLAYWLGTHNPEAKCRGHHPCWLCDLGQTLNNLLCISFFTFTLRIKIEFASVLLLIFFVWGLNELIHQCKLFWHNQCHTVSFIYVCCRCQNNCHYHYDYLHHHYIIITIKSHYHHHQHHHIHHHLYTTITITSPAPELLSSWSPSSSHHHHHHPHYHYCHIPNHS